MECVRTCKRRGSLYELFMQTLTVYAASLAFPQDLFLKVTLDSYKPSHFLHETFGNIQTPVSVAETLHQLRGFV